MSGFLYLPLLTNAIFLPSGDQVGAPSWLKSSVSFFCSEPSAFITQTSTCQSLWPSGVETRSCLTNAIFLPSGDQVGPYSGRLLEFVRAFLSLPERFIT